MATGMTFQSHRNGLVHDSVVAYDLVMPDGSFIPVTMPPTVVLMSGSMYEAAWAIVCS